MTVVRTDIGDTPTAVRDFILGVNVGNPPTAGEIVDGHLFLQAVTFPAAFAASRAVARAAATGAVVVDVRKNESNIGTITWAPAGTVGVFALAASVTFAVGDRLDFLFPSPADATLSGIKLTLFGER